MTVIIAMTVQIPKVSLNHHVCQNLGLISNASAEEV